MWSCSLDTCSASISPETVTTLVKSLQRETESQEKTTIEDLQACISKSLRVLHPHHYLIIELKKKLLAALHNLTDTEPAPSKDILTLTVEVADDIAEVFNVLDPGLTILNGRLLKFKNRPQLMLANMDMEVSNPLTLLYVGGLINVGNMWGRGIGH